MARNMPWKCPACTTPIPHATSESAPLVGRVYRCHVCRLELAVDPLTDELVLAPPPPTDEPKRRFSI
jgi:hypothetical protein